jgi:hypothetical protein
MNSQFTFLDILKAQEGKLIQAAHASNITSIKIEIDINSVFSVCIIKVIK